MQTADAWNTGRPIYSRLPGVNGRYSTEEGGNPTDWVTVFYDELLTQTKGVIDDIPRNLDPTTCDAEWLTFLAQLAGFTGDYWDEAWPEAVRRALVRDSFNFIWPNKGSEAVIKYQLDLFQIQHDIWKGSSLVVGRDTLPATLGSPQWRYYIRLPLLYLRNSDEFKLSSKINRLYGPVFEDSRVAFEQFYLGFSVAGDPVFRSAAAVQVAPPEPEVPAAPVLNAPVPGDSTITLSWSDVPEAVGYAIKWGTDPGALTNVVPTGDTQIWGLLGLTNGTTYYFAVHAYSSEGIESLASNVVSAAPVEPAPNPPTLSAPTPGDGEVALTWSASATATGYRVRWGTSSLNLTNEQDVGDVLTYTVPSLTNETQYYFAVFAYNDQEGGSSNIVSATPTSPAPDAPTLNAPTAGNGSVALSWNTVSGATGYRVKYGTSAGSLNTTEDVGNVTAASIDPLVNGTTYYFAVVAYNAQSAESVDSNIVSTAPVAPADSDYDTWETAAEAVGTLSDNEKYAVSRWFAAAKDGTDAYFSQLLHINSNKVGSDFATSLIAMVGPAMTGLDGAGESNYTRGTGFDNLDTASLDSNIASDAMDRTEACAGCRILTNRGTSGTDSIFGAGPSHRLHCVSSTAGFAQRWYTGTGSSTVGDGTGFALMRNTASDRELYMDGTILQAAGAAPGSDGTTTTIKFCQRGDSNGTTYAKVVIDWTVIATALTPAQITKLYNDIQQFDTDLANGPPAAPSELTVTNSQGYTQLNSITVNTDIWQDQLAADRPPEDPWQFLGLDILASLSNPIFIRSNKSDGAVEQPSWQTLTFDADCVIFGIFYEQDHQWLVSNGFVDSGRIITTSGPGQSDEGRLYYRFVTAAESGLTLPSNAYQTESVFEFGNTYSLILTAESVAITPATPPLNVVNPGDGQITLGWNAVDGASGYRVKWGTSAGSLTNVIDVSTSTTHVVGSLTNDTTYYFAVVAYDGRGVDSADSAVLSAAPEASGGGGGSTAFNLAFYPTDAVTEIRSRIATLTNPQSEAWIAQGNGSTGYPNNFDHDEDWATTSTYNPSPSTSLNSATDAAMLNDWDVALIQAQRWLFNPTGPNAATHAANARRIIDAWRQLSSYTGHPSQPPLQYQLQMSWGLHKLIHAAAILRDYNYAGWSATDEANFQAWLNGVPKTVLPLRPENDTTNWVCSIIYARICIACYTENHSEFETLVGHVVFFLNGGYFNDPFTDSRTNFTSGHWDETQRDLNHAGFGLSSLSEIAYILWLQGYDLYALGGNYLSKACEYFANAFINNTLNPLPSYSDYKYAGRGISLRLRGDGRYNVYTGSFEGLTAHYTNVKFIPMPLSQQLLYGPGNPGNGRSSPAGMKHHALFPTLKMGGWPTSSTLPTSGAGINL